MEFVAITEEDIRQELVKLLISLLPDVSELHQYLINPITVSQAIDQEKIVITENNENDIISLFDLIGYLSQHKNEFSNEEKGSIIDLQIPKLLKILTRKTLLDSHPKLVIILLVSLFNSISSYDVFYSLIDIALLTNQTSLFATLPPVEGYIDTLELDTEQYSKLYRVMARFYDVTGNDEKSQSFRLKYLELPIKDKETSIVDDSIKHCLLCSHCMADDCLRILDGSSYEKNNIYYNLLKYLSTLSPPPIKDLVNYIHNNSKEIKSLNIDIEYVLLRARMLRLAQIGKEKRNVSYSVAMSALNVDSEEEFEILIAKSVISNLILVKLDQPARMVFISSIPHTMIRMEEWKEVSNSLHAWLKGIREVISSVKGKSESNNK